MKEKILNLLNEINLFKKNISEDNTLPGNTYYLNDEDILCLERENGDARYPYEMDGMNLWAHSNGRINACESKLTILRTAFFQEEPCVDFWGGIKMNEKEWFPVSILGPTRQLYEPFEVERYTVYTKRAAYYIADTKKLTFSVRANITSKKQLNFTISAINKTNENIEIYLASYMDFLLLYRNDEDFWGLMNRFGKLYDNGTFELYTSHDIKNFSVINKLINIKNELQTESTVSKNVFTGSSSRSIVNAKSLQNGFFSKKIHSANTANYPIMSDIIKFTLEPDEDAYINYLCNIVTDENEAKALIENKINMAEIEADIKFQEEKERKNLSSVDIYFDKIKIPSINNNVFNKFIKNIQKQVDLCALGKNYAGAFIGVRDVFQQLDSSFLWNPSDSRKKIVAALNHIMSTGRSPRQYSVPPKNDMIPDFDMREYIDQGIWIIETVYNYLCFTNDYSILDEKCFYYEIIDEENREFRRCEQTSVMEHLIRITDYLISNVSPKTNCLKILFGDWNDALNGLGKTTDKDKKYGDGVSVMASLQLYRNLFEMTDIISHTGVYENKIKEYSDMREKIGKALSDLAIQKADDNTRHIIHGWGDKKSYDVGSIKDTDGKRRYSATAYSFWCISGLIEKDLSLKSDILHAYEKLDSKYGIKTLVPNFEPDMPGVGSIAGITPGTYENSCSYVHSTMFSAMALFIIGEGKKAWEQIEKAIPITHSYLTKTPFVMPNSYCHNDEYCMDGDSMGDWYTGSGTVLYRNIVKHTFGILPDLDGISIKPSSYMPSDNAKINITVKNSKIELIYKNENSKERKFIINGKEYKKSKDIVSDTEYIYMKNEDLKDEIKIEIID